MGLLLYNRQVLAFLKVGKKVATNGGKTRPQGLDYFTATVPCGGGMNDVAQPHKGLTEYFKKKYGTDKPKRIQVVLIDHHPEEAFFTSFAMYANGKCKCRGNEATGKALRVMDGTPPTRQEIECNRETCPYAKNGSCKPEGKLNFIIPDALAGAVQLVTKGVVGIANINQTLKDIFDVTGSLRGLSCWINVRMMPTASGNVPTVSVDMGDQDLIQLSLGNAPRFFGTLAEMKREYETVGGKPNQAVLHDMSLVDMEDGEILQGEVVDPGQEPTAPMPVQPPQQKAQEPTKPANKPPKQANDDELAF